MVYVIFSFKIIKITCEIKTGFTALDNIIAYLVAFEEEIFKRLDSFTINTSDITIIGGISTISNGTRENLFRSLLLPLLAIILPLLVVQEMKSTP
jgi:hypothetical protein